MKRIVEKGGKFYLVKGIIFIRYWDAILNYWWYFEENHHHATAFNSKEELRQAYKNTKSKFRGFL